MADNYERDENLNPCEDCCSRWNWERCRTCKHRKDKRSLIGKLHDIYKSQPEHNPFKFLGGDARKNKVPCSKKIA